MNINPELARLAVFFLFFAIVCMSAWTIYDHKKNPPKGLPKFLNINRVVLPAFGTKAEILATGVVGEICGYHKHSGYPMTYYVLADDITDWYNDTEIKIKEKTDENEG